MPDNANLHEAGRAIERAGLDRAVKTVDSFERGRQEVRPARRADADRDGSRDRLPSREERRERLRRASEGDDRRQDRRQRDDDEYDAGERRAAPKSDNRQARRSDDEDDRPQTRRRDDDADRRRRRDEEEYEAERIRREHGGPDDDHSSEPDDEDDYDDRDNSDPDGREDEREADREDDDYDGQDERQPREELFKVKVHGREFEVPREELVRGYQRQKDYQIKTAELAGQGRELFAHHQKQAHYYRTQIAQTNAILDGVKTALAGDMNSPQMQTLRHQDPEKWAVARQLMQERIDQVNTFIDNLRQTQERHEADNAGAQKEQRLATIREELRMLQEHVPDWQDSGDPDREPAQVRVGRYLVKSGFQPQEFQELTDHRMLLVAWKAMEYDRVMSRREREPRREAKPVPRTTKPGRHQGGQRPNSERQRDRQGRQRDRDQLKRTGSMRDAGKLIERML